MAGVDQVGDDLAVLVGPTEQVVRGDDPLGGAGETAVAVEAGADERLVRQVVPGEQGGDPLVEA